MEKLQILYPFGGEPPGHPGPMEGLPRQIPERDVDLASEQVRVFVSEGIVQKAGRHPSSRLFGAFLPRKSPVSHEARHTTHVFPSCPLGHGPGREDSSGGILQEGVEATVRKRRDEGQGGQPSRI